MRVREKLSAAARGQVMESHARRRPSGRRRTGGFLQVQPLASPHRATPLDRWAARQLLRLLGDARVRLALWDGSSVSVRADDPVATIRYLDRAALYRTLVRPELHWGDLYSEGRVEVEGDLAGLLARVYREMQKRRARGVSRLFGGRDGRRGARNTLRRAADNIHHHYDIGNDFYRLWLDRAAMQYTCAYYPDPAMGLEEAQVAKLRHVCRKLQLKPGDRVVEAGCGWGGLAAYMARHYGVAVTAYNISAEQVKYATRAAREQGLGDRVEYVLEDYRAIRGEYDVFVSVGMLEHVGPADYEGLGRVIRKCLKPGGRGLIHSIGRNQPEAINPWIGRRIFPGAYPPTLREMMDVFEGNGLSVLDVENLRLHYALTLAAWLRRYEQHAPQVRKMFDERFVRAWRLYLAGSKAAFDAGRLQLFQVVFARAEDNGLPWSRAHLYADARDLAGDASDGA